jgi:pimeloyl-ACP methyl ester carboxylesterase
MAQAVARSICESSPQTLLGGLPDQRPAHYAAASPVHFLPLGIPHQHINGTDDPIVPLSYVQEFVNAAHCAGDDARLIALDGVGHFEVVSAESTAFTTLLSTIKQLN